MLILDYYKITKLIIILKLTVATEVAAYYTHSISLQSLPTAPLLPLPPPFPHATRLSTHPPQSIKGLAVRLHGLLLMCRLESLSMNVLDQDHIVWQRTQYNNLLHHSQRSVIRKFRFVHVWLLQSEKSMYNTKYNFMISLQRGTGGLASRSRRFARHVRVKCPGPGWYNPAVPDSHSDFSRAGVSW